MTVEETQERAPKPRVFIHVNHKQFVGALVGIQSIRRASAHNDEFDIELIQHKDYPFLHRREGQLFLRNGVTRPWRNDDLQSFTPLRFMPPELMGYRGRALVIDPDVFAVGDVWDLLSMDLEGKAIWCRSRKRHGGNIWGPMATSVMLLDCSKLKHWKVEEQFNELFERKRDYKEWITLRHEPRETIGLLDECWNDLDVLNKRTQMLHTTRRWTQPWKTGLPIDFTPADKYPRFPPLGWLLHLRRAILGDHALLGHYIKHPDRNQEEFFFSLLAEAVEAGLVGEGTIRTEMAQDHVRHDALQRLAATKPLAETLAALPA